MKKMNEWWRKKEKTYAVNAPHSLYPFCRTADPWSCGAVGNRPCISTQDLRLIVLNVDFQPWDNITSLGCAVEFRLSWGEGGSTPSSFLYDLTLVPNTSASSQILLWCLLWNLHFSLHLPMYLIFAIWGLNQSLYPLIHAFQKLFICIPSQEGFPRGSINFLIFF